MQLNGQAEFLRNDVPPCSVSPHASAAGPHGTPPEGKYRRVMFVFPGFAMSIVSEVSRAPAPASQSIESSVQRYLELMLDPSSHSK